MPSAAELDELRRCARDSLQANIHRLGDRSYLSAGRHQFKSLWTRDFCWSVRGLLAIGEEAVVSDHIDLCLDAMDDAPADQLDLVPRTFDSMDPSARVAECASLQLQRRLDLGSLTAYHLDQHQRLAIDGNVLVALAALQYAQHQGAPDWWNQRRDKIKRALAFYDRHTGADGLLIAQPPFSDWQDSADRRGSTFYTNLLYARALRGVAAMDPDLAIDPARIDALERRVEAVFFGEQHVYRSIADDPHISLDGNLLAIDLGYLDDVRAQQLFYGLRQSTLWEGPAGPGFVTSPDYPWRSKDWVMKYLATLGAYHDRLYWSWLIALTAKVAVKMTRLGHRDAQAVADVSFSQLLANARRDGGITEVYAFYSQDRALKAYSTLAYTSETPFSWGAAFVIDAVDFALGT